MSRKLNVDACISEPTRITIGGTEYSVPVPEDMPVSVEVAIHETQRRFSEAIQKDDPSLRVEALYRQLKILIPELPDDVMHRLSLRQVREILDFVWRPTEASDQTDDKDGKPVPSPVTLSDNSGEQSSTSQG